MASVLEAIHKDDEPGPHMDRRRVGADKRVAAHKIGFVVEVPRAGSPGVGSGLSGLPSRPCKPIYYDIYHSSAELLRAFMECFKPQCI